MDETSFDPIDEALRQWRAHDLGEPLAMAVATSIAHAHQLVSTAIDRALKPLGLTFARYEVLMLLVFSRAGELPITKVGERLLVHPTGITRLVDKLEAEDLVRRRPHPTDRRGVLVRITPAGRQRADEASDVVATVRFGVDLPDAELLQLYALLGRLRSSYEG